MKPHIILIIARGEAVRNFIFSDTLKCLSENADITLLTLVDHGEAIEHARSYVKKIIALQEFSENELVAGFRYLLHTAHFRWIWSEAAKYHFWGHYDMAKTWKAKLKRGILTFVARFLAFRWVLEFGTRLEQWLSVTFRPTVHFDQLFQDLRPDLVFNCSHIHGPQADLPCRIAHSMGIKTATFIFSWDNLTSRSRIFVPYDYYIMWNEEMKKQLLSQYPYLNPGNVIVTGTPQFDFHFNDRFLLSREALAKKVGFDPNRPFILYTTGLDRDFPDEHKFVEEIIRVIEHLDIHPRPQLILRAYIKGTSPEMYAVGRNGHSSVIFPPILWDEKWTMPLYEDLSIYTSLLHHCILGINVASTVSLELMILDKPVINIGMEPPETFFPYPTRFSRHVEYEHYKTVAESGGVKIVRKLSDFNDFILRAFRSPQEDSLARKAWINTMFDGRMDGKAGARVADALIAITQS